jgi:hypothetical protein
MNREWIPTVAGVFEIVAAVCALIGSLALVFSALMIEAVPDIQDDPDVPVELIVGLLIAVAGFICVAGIVSLVGGIAGIRRQGWGWALAGSIAAVFLLPPAGILALVMTIIGEKEFRERLPEQRDAVL